MVIRILTGKDVAGAVRYNEQKVEQGQAERIHVANYPNAEMAGKHARFRLQLLEQYTRLNPAVKKPSVHLTIAFHPTERITKGQLCEIGGEVMNKAGYGKQPYLMYQHRDTQHPHIHIVTVSVDAHGNRISDRFMQRRLQQIRRQLEIKYGLVQAERSGLAQRDNRVGEGLIQARSSQQSISERIDQTLETYSFGSVDSLKQYLKAEGIVMNTKAGRSQRGTTFQFVDGSGANNRPVKASSLPSRPTYERLTERITGQEDRHLAGCEKLAHLIHQRLATYRSLTEPDFRQSLHRFGVEVIEAGSNYLYVRKRTGIIAKDEELDTSLTRKTLVKQFGVNNKHVVTDKAQQKNWAETRLNRRPTATSPKQPEGVKNGEQVGKAVTLIKSQRSELQMEQLKDAEKNEVDGIRVKPLADETPLLTKVDLPLGPAKKNQKKNRLRKTHRL